MSSFFTWLATLAAWQSMLIFLIVTCILIFLIYLLVNKGIQLRYKGSYLTFGKGEQWQSLPYSPHRDCPYKKDIVILLNDVNKLQYEKFHLMGIDLIKEQMKYCEQRIDFISSIMKKHFLKILEEKGIENPITNKGFISYKNVLKALQADIIDYFRISMRDNHFDDMTEEAFKDYCENKWESLSNMSTDFLNNFYVDYNGLTRGELYTRNKELFPSIKNEIMETFQTARRIKIDYNVKVIEINERMDRLIHNYI